MDIDRTVMVIVKKRKGNRGKNDNDEWRDVLKEMTEEIEKRKEM
jgi:hypothetical protein